ncbi:J domain-containing protein [Amycolatopsis orientalis]|uniref:J domain-containing protein n=1 Tax=Amycolatopsis orientalis TaxID=31958 RepID=UPI0003A1BD8B|nr:J domain-containing protein [Amycolatopsis orientalis]
MTRPSADPHRVLGLSPDATEAEITTAYRRAVRACHPDTAHPDLDRLAAVLEAYRQLRPPPTRESSAAQEIPVRRHRPAPRRPDLRAGPVRRHPDTP